MNKENYSSWAVPASVIEFLGRSMRKLPAIASMMLALFLLGGMSSAQAGLTITEASWNSGNGKLMVRGSTDGKGDLISVWNSFAPNQTLGIATARGNGGWKLKTTKKNPPNPVPCAVSATSDASGEMSGPFPVNNAPPDCSPTGPGDNTPPDVTNPGNQINDEGDMVSLQIDATDDDSGDTLTYSAAGLPADLSIDANTGLISGTVAIGAAVNSPYTVTVNVSDGTDTTPVTFLWEVNAVAMGRAVPTLQGHIPNPPEPDFHDPETDRILPYEVQAAYTDSTFFWRLSYEGEEGKRHQYLRYSEGVWNKEGGDRRDAQASIDDDPQQGDTDILTTIYEQRTSIMINDPNGATNVERFGDHGCFLACHNVSRHMPEWTSANGHDGKYIDPALAGSPTGTPVLDLWHWRGARSNPIGRSDDQNILSLDFVNSSSGDDGGRKGDSGQSVFFNQGLDAAGNPEWLLDPSTTMGAFVFPWEAFWTTPFYYMTTDDALLLGPDAPNPGIMAYADAVIGGYLPVEGDTVPRRILRAGAGSRADITAFGTTYTPDPTAADPSSFGLWNVQLQRALDTGNVDDIAMVPGQVYEAGFEVHLWEYTTRDHYVSFPVTVGVGPNAGPADIVAVDLGSGGPEGALDIDWDAIPKTQLNLFQPGITTYEFLTGQNEADGKQYTNAQGQLVDQVHGGSGGVIGGAACVGCHSVTGAGLSMENLTDQRGGVWEDTPVVAE
jgi:hypothetical protein